jgi:NDP-sugar pyrophosphorylase family protein
VKAVFLAGGVGKRFAPIRKDKCLLKFCGRELILRQMDAVRRVGIDQVVVVCNPGNREPMGALLGSRAELAVQPEPSGMAGALLAARPLVGHDPILVVNADDVFEDRLYEQVVEAGAGCADACLAAYEVDRYFPGGYLVLRQGEVQRIVEKPGAGNEPSNLVNIVVHLHNDPQELLARLQADSAGGDDVYERTMAAMIADGKRFRAVPYTGFWGPIKYPWHVLVVMRHFIEREATRVAASASVHPSASLCGRVVVEDGARVFQGAAVNGPAYLGRGAIVGNNALVRDGADVEAGSVVGYCTEVKASYVGEDCWFHTNYVGDSVVADGCSLGSGAVTANLRLDERHVMVKVGDALVDTGTNKLGALLGEGARLGVQACTMPGVRVGAGAFVGSGVCLRQDLAPGKMLVLRQQTELRDAPPLDSAGREEMMRRLTR